MLSLKERAFLLFSISMKAQTCMLCSSPFSLLLFLKSEWYDKECQRGTQ